MGQTHFSGPLIVGDNQNVAAGSSNQGFAQCLQGAVTIQNGTTVVTSQLNLPAGAVIFDITVDILTAFNSATSATLSIGTTPGGTQYASGVDVKTATGRFRPTFTAAQLAAAAGLTVGGAAAPIAGPLYITVTSVGTPSAGVVYTTVEYAPAQAN